MTKYLMLLNVLDRIAAEGRASKLAGRYTPDGNNPESLNQVRSRAYIHLYLMVRFGLNEFVPREHWITDGPYDGGIDGYFIASETHTVYLIQSKFRATENNFIAKEIHLGEILRMDVNRILEGHPTDEASNPYCGKILQLQSDIAKVLDIGRYSYQVVILANLHDQTAAKLKQLTGGYDTKVIDAEECYSSLLFPVISGTYFNATDLNIHLDLSNKSSSAARISYTVTTAHANCEITVVFVPTIEIAKTLSKYKNSILKFNPRSYLELSGLTVNSAIRETIEKKDTNEFALLNNGITMLSDETGLNERIGQRNKAQLVVKNPQIINGGQTAYTLGKIFEDHQGSDAESVFSDKEVLLKIITIIDSEERRTTEPQRLALIEEISTATNQQTAVAKADRISNEGVYLEIQSQFFSRFGILFERKRGEFADGLSKGYIDESEIVERNKLFRVYFAVRGNIGLGAAKKAFLQCKRPEVLLADDATMRHVAFGLACYNRLTQRRRRAQRAERDRETVAKLYALSQNIPDDTNKFENEINLRLAKLPIVWGRFIETVVHESGDKYVRTTTDLKTGANVTVLATSKLFKSSFFEKKVVEHFRGFDWEGVATPDSPSTDPSVELDN
jgi:AIPR protein